MDSQHNPSQPTSPYSLNDRLPLHSDASYEENRIPAEEEALGGRNGCWPSIFIRLISAYCRNKYAEKIWRHSVAATLLIFGL